MLIYVGNLAYGASAADLVSLFSPYGPVRSATVARDHATGRARDFGFISLSSRENGRAAIAGLNGKQIVGRSLEVGRVRDRAAAAPGGLR